MRFSIEGETGHGDGGIQPDNVVRIERILPAASEAIGKPAIRGYGISYTGNDRDTIAPDVITPPTHSIVEVIA